MDGAWAGFGCRLSTRQIAGLLVHACIVLALAVAYVRVAPPANWRDPLTLAVLIVFGVIAIRTEVSLPSGVTFESLSALALITTALAGAVPAVIVTAFPIVVNAFTGRERLLRAGNLANLAAYGGQALAGALVLRAGHGAGGAAAFGWLVAAGLTQMLVNWALGPALYVTFWLGHPVRTIWHVLADGVATSAVMTALAAAVVLLSPVIGVLALAVFAVIALLPQSFLTYAARTRPVGRLSQPTATRRYALALALELELSREERRHLSGVLAAAEHRPPTGEALDYVRATIGNGRAANLDAQLATEWVNGNGGPIGLSGEAIPLVSRIVAVAGTWSALTARGTLQLGHHDVLAHLRGAAGTRLDPVVVEAAAAVVAQERVTASEPAPEPRLHLRRLPASVRRALVAG
jgi:hypothetical protein